MGKVKFLFISLVCVLGIGGTASAQRTANGSFFMDFQPSVTFKSAPSAGLSVGVGQYRLSSFWRASVSAMDYRMAAVADNGGSMTFDYLDATAGFDWMFRLLSSPTRSVNFYLGGGAFIGADIPQVFEKLSSDYFMSGMDTAFIYGIQPVFDLEFYVSNKVSLVIDGRLPFSFGGQLGPRFWNASLSFGCRFNL